MDTFLEVCRQRVANANVNSSEIEELLHLGLPDYVEIREPLATASRRQALSAEFTNLAFTALYKCANCSGSLIYGGMLKVNGWDAGRPARRWYQLRAARKQTIRQAFLTKTENQLRPMIYATYMNDLYRNCAWVYTVNILDPLTQIETNKNDISKCSNHLVCVIIKGNSVSVIDPLMAQSPMKFILKLVSTVFCSLLTECINEQFYDKPAIELRLPSEIQHINEHTCVLWCLWITYHVCACPLDVLDTIRDEWECCPALRLERLKRFIMLVQKSILLLLIEIDAHNDTSINNDFLALVRTVQ